MGSDDMLWGGVFAHGLFVGNRPSGCNQSAKPRSSTKGQGRPIRLRDFHVRSYVNCGCAKTKGRHSGFGPITDIASHHFRVHGDVVYVK